MPHPSVNDDDRFHWHRLLPALIVAVAVLAYINPYESVLTVPFIFDDEPWINMTAQAVDRGPASLFARFANDRRAMVVLTMAINYWIDGEDPAGYHLLNVLIHALAGLALYGVVHRTLLLPRLCERFAPVARGLAFAAALLFVVHPLATQAVTYIVQRAESMMALFFLFSLYCAIRLLDGRASRAVWLPLMTLAALMGMWSKEIMAVLPVVVVLYDRAFTAWSVREQLARRWPVYALLASTWSVLILGGLLGQITAAKSSVGLAADFTTPWQYALTQPKIIFHYLFLSVWPGPLVFDYAWSPAVQPPSAAGWDRDRIISQLVREVLPWSAALLAIAVTCLVGWWRRWWWGFAGLAFLVILAPTSSFVPIADLAVEHRMYLPLTIVCTAVVVALYMALRRALAGVSLATVHAVAIVLLLGVSAALFVRTVVRHGDYQSEQRLWYVTMQSRPYNARALVVYGQLLVRQGRVEEGVRYLDTALELVPNRAGVLNDLANIFVRQGMYDRAAAYFDQALAMTPDDATMHFNVAEMHARLRQWDRAIASLERAIELRPGYAQAYNMLGRAYWVTHNRDQAVEQFHLALEHDPLLGDAYANIAHAHQVRGELAEALEVCERGLSRARDRASLHARRGQVLVAMGRRDEAMASFERAIEDDPHNEQAYIGIAGLCVERGRIDLAQQVLAAGMEQHVRMPLVEREWGKIIVTQPQASREQVQRAYDIAAGLRETAGDDVTTWVFFAQAAARRERVTEAVDAMDRAIELRTAQPDAPGPDIAVLRALRADMASRATTDPGQ